MTGKTRNVMLAGILAALVAAGCQGRPVVPAADGRATATYRLLGASVGCPAPASPTPSVAPSWPPSRHDECLPYVDPPGVGPRITAGTTTYSSTFEPLAADVFSTESTYCNRWNNGATGSATVTRTLGAFYPVRHVRLDMAIGDPRNGPTSYRMELRTAAGWQVIDTLTDTGIGFSHPNYRRTLSPPVQADAFRLTMTGQGWFTAYGFGLYE